MTILNQRKMKKKKYKPCEVCECGDCRTGKYREEGSWMCPVLKKQICSVCCYFDMDSVENTETRKQCKKIKCEHYEV